jgi:hypothetical protein
MEVFMSMNYKAVCQTAGDLDGTPYRSGTANANNKAQKQAEQHEASHPGHFAEVTQVWIDDDTGQTS